MSTQTEFEVDGWNNFCRVFELPEAYPKDFCFGGGLRVNFQLVDWFYPVSQSDVPIAAVSKEVWRTEVGGIETKTISLDELADTLIPFLLEKKYVKRGRDYLVLMDFGGALRFSGS